MELGNQFNNYRRLQDYVLLLQDLGYYAIYYDDALHWAGFECWSILTAIAENTQKIRIGPSMSFFSYRHPVLLAKSAATLDIVSDGRLEFRVGAGDIGVRNDSRRFGTSFPSPTKRVCQLREGLEIIKSLWCDEITSFNGKSYNLLEASVLPIPIQKPTPPFTIAGEGMKMLELCVDHANVWESSNTDHISYERMVLEINDICKKKSMDTNKLGRSLEVFVALNNNKNNMEKIVRNHAELMGLSINDPWINRWLIGGVESCRKFFEDFINLGVREFVIVPITDDLKWFTEKFSLEIIKKFA